MHYDAIICGGGTSGVVSAISCRRNGCQVLVIEETGVLGGTNVLSLVGPLMSFHDGKKQVVKGIAQEIINRLEKNHSSFGHILDPLGFASSITPVDIEALKALYFQMFAEEQIDVLFHTYISDVIVKDNKVVGIEIVNKDGKNIIYGDCFIDCTGDGDVAKLAGCEYKIGRSSDELCQPMSMLFTVGNVEMDKVIAYMKENAFDFVLRDDYDYKYIGVSGFFSKVSLAVENNDFDIPRDRVLFFQDLNKNEVTINMTRVQKLSGVNAMELSKAEFIGREQIRKAFSFLKKYIPGFENITLVRTPERIGVRETRHIIGEYYMEYNDVANNCTFEDSIAIGSFPMDIHSPDSIKLEEEARILNVCYEIPMRVLIPKKIDGLIISGRCVSASYEASASMRLSPVAMALGEASGVLASQAIKNKIEVRNVNYKNVQDQLKKQGQVFKK